MRRYRGRRSRRDPHGPPPDEWLEPLAEKICRRLRLPRRSVRYLDSEWQFERCGRWVPVPWYVYCVDPAREE